MSTEPRRGDALQLIYSIFIGVLTAVVVGVGVWTFYTPPFSENSPKQQELQELQEKQGRYYEKPGGTGELTPAEKKEFDAREDRILKLNRELQALQKVWAVWTSIIVISIATILMAISLFLPESAKVFSNGILLGGLFTVLYGTGVSFSGGDSRARFFVVLTALVLSLAIGYLRFIRARRAAEAAAPVEGAAVVAGDLEARVAALEAKLGALASAFGGARE